MDDAIVNQATFSALRAAKREIKQKGRLILVTGTARMNVIVSHIYATKSTGVCWRFAVIDEMKYRLEKTVKEEHCRPK